MTWTQRQSGVSDVRGHGGFWITEWDAISQQSRLCLYWRGQYHPIYELTNIRITDLMSRGVERNRLIEMAEDKFCIGCVAACLEDYLDQRMCDARQRANT